MTATVPLRRLHIQAAPDGEADATYLREGEESPEHSKLAEMLDALDIAQFGVTDAREALRTLYKSSTTTASVERFLAVEAVDQDIVTHLAAAARSLRAAQALVRSSHHNSAPHPE